MSLIRMVRNPEQHLAPHSADVHENEVAGYRKGGYVLVSEATWPVSEQQQELPLTPPQTGTQQQNTGNTSANSGWGTPAQT